MLFVKTNKITSFNTFLCIKIYVDAISLKIYNYQLIINLH